MKIGPHIYQELNNTVYKPIIEMKDDTLLIWDYKLWDEIRDTIGMSVLNSIPVIDEIRKR